MAGLGEPDHPTRRLPTSFSPEFAELGLPSSYLRGSLEASALLKMSDLEAELRRAVCNDALKSLRTLLGAKAIALKWKRKNTSGEVQTTRAVAALKIHEEKVERARWRYNNSRDGLMRLGDKESDIKTYQELKKGDLKNLKDYLEEESPALGQGYRSIPWLWRTAAIANEEEWQLEGMYERPD